ncbi:MAG: hypothetical protein A3F16_03645 [Deltaproteobacteria bacterium RIFCSPHIGHO2_12_FULL_43_9]|nr:MAG: hypothetical protein A3F16_03645 [Deltaproteobacteria bacterium RIFCSPHIGHO2_12_FULL_43_9]
MPTIFITGASSGIGAALAKEYARHGANLILTARRIDRLSDIAKECKKINSNSEILTFQCDVRHEEGFIEPVKQAIEKFGSIDTVIANAGFGVSGALIQLKVEDYRRQFETNVFGVLNTIYATLPELKKSKGKLAIISSVAAYLDLPNSSAYSMSKAAVKSLGGSIYMGLGRYGISVTTICPGFVESEIYRVDNKGVFQPEKKEVVPSWLQMKADKAAKQIRCAIEKRKREAVITLLGKLLVFIYRHFPWIYYFLSRKFYRS